MMTDATLRSDVIDESDVKLVPSPWRSDTAITLAVEAALKWNALIGPTPGGQVSWNFQRPGR